MKQATLFFLAITLIAIGFVSPPLMAESSAPVLTNGSVEIYLGAPASHKNLTLYPLLAATVPEAAPYTPLDKAMDRRKLRIKELGSATVPKLDVANTGKDNVFIMTGEIVTGAKQDRMSAHDVILPPTSKPIHLAVYCVEQGRWHHNSRQFSAGKTAGTTGLRKTAAKKGGQGVIWSKVAKKSRDAAVHSNTGTMQAVYNSGRVKQRIRAYENALKKTGAGKDVVGFAAAVDGEIVVADLFVSHTLFEALFAKLLKAIAIDAVTSPSPVNASPTDADVRAFLATGVNGSRTRTDNPGLGDEYLIEATGDISGTVLIHNDRMVHLSVFGPDKDEKPRALHRVDGRRANQSRSSSGSANQEKNAWVTDDKKKSKSSTKARSKPETKSTPKPRSKSKSKPKSESKRQKK